ncbi:MAG: CDP-glycerol glycerophosphotransferase family protein, partial [Senegalia sp. (in: firmicutes)]
IQEIDFSEKFAFVEYWGRGYTQDCLNRLINNICSTDIDIIFFYARSIYPSFGTSIRFNYTSKMTSLIFIESIFNNLPYKSVSGYKFNQHKIEPIIAGKEYDKHLYNKINEILPKFINDFYSLNFVDLDEIERNFYDFGVDYFKNKPEDPLILKYFAPLKDSVVLFEPEQEYAPPITYKMAAKKLLGKRVELRSKNKKMSLKRSPKGVQLAYNIYNNKIKNNKISKKIYKYIRKR